MRWFVFLVAVGLVIQGVAAANAQPRSFVRQCERQGLTQGTPAFKACIDKRTKQVERERREAQRWSP